MIFKCNLNVISLTKIQGISENNWKYILEFSVYRSF